MSSSVHFLGSPGAQGVHPASSGGERSATNADGSRPKVSSEIELFQRLMSAPQLARQWAQFTVVDYSKEGDDEQLGGGAYGSPGDDRRRAEVDAISPTSSVHVTESTLAPRDSSPAVAPDLTFAELVEKHIRRALAGVSADGSEEEVRIELSDAALPATALSLRRTSEGWLLLVVSSDRRSRETFEKFAPALIQRFTQSSLGRLETSFEDRDHRIVSC
jgi:hypothetical protein